MRTGAPALAQTTLPASSADWIVQGDQPTGTFGADVAAAGDINGDGYDDVLIGDASYDGALADSGRIRLYLGSSDGLSQTPFWTLEGDVAGARLSRGVPAGDVNGDGYDDIVVATAQTYSLYLGSPTGPILEPSWTSSGTGIGHGDVNGDGFTDLAVFSNPEFLIFQGSPAGLEPAPSTVLPLPSTFYPPRYWYIFGPILDDFDLDGRDDLAYTWRHCNGKRCQYLVAELRVHMGSGKGLSTHVRRTIDFARERVPFIVPAGDADGDGFPDAAINEYADGAGGHGPPVTYLLRGGPSGLPVQLDEPAIEDPARHYREYGSGSGAGDINGDGYADYLLLLEDVDRTPRLGASLWIFGGAPGGYSGTPLLIVDPEQYHYEFEFSGFSAGDVNGDGLDDIVIGAPGFYQVAGARVGRVYVFHGRATF